MLGSLTLGGYDQSRFTPNQMSFSFAPDTDRDIVVSIQDITSEDQDGSTNSLLPSAINAYIDSTIAQIWLPLEACQAFEKAFGLNYDEDNQIYPVNDTQHEKLLAQNASISFTLGNSPTGGDTIVITLPYNSFDLEATPPFSPNRTKYFPLQRAANETQYTLGRTFLQEAYLIVDWERGNFSVSQCLFDPNNLQEKLLPINSVNVSSNSTSISHHSSTNTGEIIGIAVGVAMVIVLLIIGAIIFFVRKKRKQRQQADATKPEIEDDESVKIRQGFAKAELDADIGHARYEMGESNDDHARNAPAGWVEEKARHPGQHAELMGDKMLPELTAGGVAASELSSQKGFAGPYHEMYDPSAPPVELPADMPRELPASSPSLSNSDSSSSSPIFRTVNMSPIQRSAGSSPFHRSSGNTSPVNNQTGLTFQSRSSTTRSSRSRPSAPFQDIDSSRGPSTPSKSGTSSPREHEPFSPISPIGNGEDGSDNGALFSLFRSLEQSKHSAAKSSSKQRRRNEF